MSTAPARQGPRARTALRPSRKKQLQQFLGFVGYYSHFIANFASTAGPLTDCLGKAEPDVIQWTPTRTRAFKDLRKSLSDSLSFITRTSKPRLSWLRMLQRRG